MRHACLFVTQAFPWGQVSPLQIEDRVEGGDGPVLPDDLVRIGRHRLFPLDDLVL